MTPTQTFVQAVLLAVVFGACHCLPFLGDVPEVDPVMVRFGDDAILPVPGLTGILSVMWQAPNGVVLGLWAQGSNGGSSGVAYSHVPQYGSRLNITNKHLQITTVQFDDSGNYTVTVVTNGTSGVTIASLVVELKVYEDTSTTHSVSETLEAANSGLDDISVPSVDQRNADPCTTRGCTWEKSTDGNVYVPYVLGNEYSLFDRNNIERGMSSFQSSSCIRFRPRQSERDYLRIYSGEGCSSFVGRQGGEQVVSLQRQGCLFLGTIQHEFLHALGFHHEHQRSDRNNHVHIAFENVKSGKERNFDQVDTQNLNTPYDYSSVMHYQRTAFSKNNQATIVPIPDSSVLIGRAISMSTNDITRLNKLYECDALSVRLAVQSTAIEGENVILQCTWSGKGQGTVTWRKNGGTLTQGSRITISEGLLQISHLEREDMGEYSCTVATAETSETTRAQLTVHYKCLTLGGLIGIVIACFIVLCALCITIFLLVRQRQAKWSHTVYGVSTHNPNFMPYRNS